MPIEKINEQLSSDNSTVLRSLISDVHEMSDSQFRTLITGIEGISSFLNEEGFTKFHGDMQVASNTNEKLVLGMNAMRWLSKNYFTNLTTGFSTVYRLQAIDLKNPSIGEIVTIKPRKPILSWSTKKNPTVLERIDTYGSDYIISIDNPYVVWSFKFRDWYDSIQKEIKRIVRQQRKPVQELLKDRGYLLLVKLSHVSYDFRYQENEVVVFHGTKPFKATVLSKIKREKSSAEISKIQTYQSPFSLRPVQIKQYEISSASISYEVYCKVLASTDYEQLSFTFSGLAAGVVSVLKELKEGLSELADHIKIDADELVKLWTTKEAFSLMKIFKFSLGAVLKSLKEASSLMHKGLLKTFHEMHKSGTLRKIQTGAIKFQEVLNEYPILKALSGIALAGLLLYCWFNMSYTGNPDYDFDLSDIAAAISGHYTIADLLGTPEGLMMIGLLGAGMTGISFPWLLSSKLCLVVAMCFTLAKRGRDSDVAKRLYKLIR